ncbi:Putative flippase GtrA (transmembrane translocase of bactoprenol-linked glucose) [Rhodococcus maanshanensis]|uniref:Putative flippase GtrA (Transmembrane translocase of bactoprenol-linked glucose) n=1 Tax=Rhodococcus maanshanensis TaxID=183556 RepID=A0A1H7W9W2_9NOCA|nr:Putative flippase GtrA (transmembrane translocase of bactoprenol-linked glucose) [Rhodococcus maanshanensis]
MPQPMRDVVLRHHELIKFAIVGGTTMVFDLAIFYSLSLTILEQKPVVAKIISGVMATILSYILNREWSFKNRGGRERHHEALLFFTISGIGVVISAAPLFIANNIFDIRASASLTTLVIVDFVLNYIIGNVLQMIFRFWALRRFAFPEENARGAAAGSTDFDPTPEELAEEELGHS